VLGLAAAVLLMQPFPLRNLVRALTFLPGRVPGLVAALGWRWLLDEQSGAVNAWLTMSGWSASRLTGCRTPIGACFPSGWRQLWQRAALLHHDVWAA